MKNLLNKIKIYKNAEFEKSDRKKVVWYFLAPFLLTLVLFVMTMIFGLRPDRFFMSQWYWKIIITYIFLLSLQGFIFALCHSGLASFIITSVIAYIFEFVNETMYLLTGDPLLPTDLFMAGNLGEIAGFIEIPFTFAEFLGLILILLIIILYSLFGRENNTKAILLRIFSLKFRICYFVPAKKKKTRLPIKAILSVILIAVFLVNCYLLALDRDFRHITLENLGVTRRAFNPIEDYQASGAILTFLPRVGDMLVPVPENYSQETVKEALNSITDKLKVSDIEPNIIAIQNEAWWDPTVIPNAEFSIDPMALYHEYEKDFVHVKTGFMKTPVFAGGTCMPEFEFLTGMSTLNLPSNTYPYIQSIKGDTASFIQEYRNNGYETIAIHPYKKNFYERDTAYKFLGFNKFLGDADMTYTDKKGHYISDESASREIIKEFENKGDKKAYIFCVTMQNHGGYTTKRYDNYDVTITSEALTEEDNSCLTDFTQGVIDTMEAFKVLTDYFETVQEPTLIVMYGDHLPLLGSSGETYINGGMIADEYLSGYSASPNLYETPYIIWANYDISKTKIEKVLSPAALGLEIFKMSGLDNIPPYYSLYDKVYEYVPIYHHHMLVKKDGKPFNEKDDFFLPVIKNYKLIQYDLLHGKKYAYEGAEK